MALEGVIDDARPLRAVFRFIVLLASPSFPINELFDSMATSSDCSIEAVSIKGAVEFLIVVWFSEVTGKPVYNVCECGLVD